MNTEGERVQLALRHKHRPDEENLLDNTNLEVLSMHGKLSECFHNDQDKHKIHMNWMTTHNDHK